MEWLGNQLKKFFNWMMEQLFDLVIWMINLIPLPDWATNINVSLPPSVAFFADMFQLPQGLAIMMSALGIRFIIRLLPIIT